MTKIKPLKLSQYKLDLVLALRLLSLGKWLYFEAYLCIKHEKFNSISEPPL